MDAIRYYLALLTIVGVPFGITWWLVLHPFVRVWRRAGPAATYTVVLMVVALVDVAIFLIREPLLRVRHEPIPALTVIGLALLVPALYLGYLRWQVFPNRVLAGVPEVSHDGGKLITSGVYARIRHPRYVEGGLAVLALALITGYRSMYALVALYVVLIAVVLLLEERELRDRFGEEYVRYCEQVPRFVPRRSSSP